MFLGVRILEPVVLDAAKIPHDLHLLVAKTSGQRTKQVNAPIERAEDVAGFMEMVRVKWEFLEDVQGHAANRRR